MDTDPVDEEPDDEPTFTISISGDADIRDVARRLQRELHAFLADSADDVIRPDLLALYQSRIDGFHDGTGNWPTRLVLSGMQFTRLSTAWAVRYYVDCGPEGATVEQLAAVLAPKEMEEEFSVVVGTDGPHLSRPVV